MPNDSTPPPKSVKEYIFKLIAGIFPASVLASFLLYPLQFLLFTHSTVGRLLAFIVILVYGYIDVLFGLLAAAIVVLYYQTDISKSLNDSENSFGFS